MSWRSTLTERKGTDLKDLTMKTFVEHRDIATYNEL